MRVRDADPEEKKILRENGLDPNEYGVIHFTESELRLLCYSTRCYIVIEAGDRPWQA